MTPKEKFAVIITIDNIPSYVFTRYKNRSMKKAHEKFLSILLTNNPELTFFSYANNLQNPTLIKIFSVDKNSVIKTERLEHIMKSILVNGN